MFIGNRVIVLMILVFMSLSTSTAGEFPFKIPYIENIEIDGSKNDWAERGYQIHVFTGEDGIIQPTNDLETVVSLAWDRNGLLVLAEIKDDSLVESSDSRKLKDGDSIELWLADGIGSRNYYCVYASALNPASSAKARYDIRDTRKFRDHFRLSDIKTGKKINGNNYLMELRIPWGRLGIHPEMNQQFAMQIFLNDRDGSDTGNTSRMSWFPNMKTPRDLTKLYPLLLSDKASEDYQVQVHRIIQLDSCTVRVTTVPELIGRGIKFYLGNEIVGNNKIVASNGWGISELHFGYPESGNSLKEMEIIINGETVAYYPKTTNVEFILNRYFRASGFDNSLSRTKERIYEGEVVHDLSYKDPPIERIPITVKSVTLNQWLVTTETKDGIDVEGFDGITGWHSKNGQVKDFKNKPLNPLFYVLDSQFPLMIRSIFPDIKFLEKKNYRGDWVYELECVDVFGETSRLRFDVESGLLQGINIYDLKDYREINGLKIPHRIYTNRKGGSTNFIFTSIEDREGTSVSDIAFPHERIK